MLRDRDLVSVQEARQKVELAWAAFEKYRHFTQEQVDAVVEAMAAAGKAHAERLARLAVEETKYGNVKDKVGKNLLTSDLLARYIRGMKTVGVLRELPEKKIIEIAMPMGVVAALVPTTNPTSTVIFKSIISLKAGNAVVLSPHPRAIRCTVETADLMYRAAREAGAPEGIVQCLEHPTAEAIQALMRHERTAVILATGGQGMVRAAYSSGKPAFGVGPGNTPVLLDVSADLPAAIEQVVVGKAFDYGTVCTSEQALVCEVSLKERVLAELKKQKALLCDEGQKQALARLLLKENYRINPECVGQSPTRLAEMAGFAIPPDTSILVAEVEGVGKQHPLSVEKLSPVLALYFVRDFPAAMDTCEAVLRFGGYGHTCVIFSKDDARIREFGLRMPAMRVLVNTAAPQGSTGVTTNLPPSMTLGCGAMAGNVTGDNIGPKHLINIKRIAYGVRRAEEVLQVPPLGEAIPVSTGAMVDRAAIAAAVEKYLAERGVSVAAAPARPAPAAGAAAEVVDRFLAARRAPKPPECSTCTLEPRPAPATAPPAETIEPPKPRITIADFVCEADVRAALEKGRRIYIGPKTIVTPSARELAERQEVLVVAERK